MEGQGRKRARSQDGANDPKKPKKQTKRPYCGVCTGCLEKEDCRVCVNCKDKSKFGGPDKRHARCIKRQCQKLKNRPNEQTNKKDLTGDQQHKQQQQQQQQVQKMDDLTVQLNHSIGRGSFGTVYKASYQDTPAAAKYLHHPVREYESFKDELETLQKLTHPNLVAYQTVTMCPGPQSRRRPVLVMELMEKSLTQFLEEAENNIPVHLQVSICLDITFALAYLHSQQIVHGHLTSNNVLLVGTTAKVADFGLSKLLDTQSSGTHNALYLPPEARVTHQFSEKSDIFSLGVLLVQIITREAPTPTPQQQLVPLSEVDRRQQHIQKIASTHPLRDIALLCLKDTAMERPTAKKVLTKLTTVRYHPQYEDSLKQEREMAQREISQLKEKLKSKEKQILQQSQEKEKQLGIAQQEIEHLKEKLNSEQLKYKEESQELHKQLKDKDKKIKDVEHDLQLVLENESEREQDLKELEETKMKLKNTSKKVQDKDKQIQVCKKDIKKLQQQCKEKDVKILELKSTMDKIASLASAATQ